MNTRPKRAPPPSPAQPAPPSKRSKQSAPSQPIDINLNLFDVFSENLRGVLFSNTTNSLESQYVWYFVFRAQIFCDSLHDFVFTTGSRITDRNRFKLIAHTLFLNDIIRIYNLLFVSTPGTNTIIAIKNSFFPVSSSTVVQLEIINVNAWCRYLIENGDKLSEDNLFEISFQLLLKINIFRQTLQYHQYNLNYVSIEPRDLLFALGDNYQPPSRSGRNRTPKFTPPVVLSCDTTQQVNKYQYLLPLIDSLSKNQQVSLKSKTNVYDSGPNHSWFNSAYTMIPIDNYTEHININVYFDFMDVNNQQVLHRENMITAQYINNGLMLYRYFNLTQQRAPFTNSFTNINPLPISRNVYNSSVNYNSTQLNTILGLNPIDNLLVYENFLYFTGCKFMGDFGKVLFTYSKQIIDTNNVHIHILTDNVGSNISGMFLPGTIFSSLSQGSVADQLGFEFFFKRDPGMSWAAPFNYPSWDELEARRGPGGLNMPTFGKKHSNDLVTRDIKYLKNI